MRSKTTDVGGIDLMAGFAAMMLLLVAIIAGIMIAKIRNQDPDEIYHLKQMIRNQKRKSRRAQNRYAAAMRQYKRVKARGARMRQDLRRFSRSRRALAQLRRKRRNLRKQVSKVCRKRDGLTTRYRHVSLRRAANRAGKVIRIEKRLPNGRRKNIWICESNLRRYKLDPKDSWGNSYISGKGGSSGTSPIGR